MRLELAGIVKTFGALRANDGIDLTVEPGTIHGLLGENGAGKSTLMKILSGFIHRDAGQIRLDGRLAEYRTPAQALQAGVGMLHQDPLDFAPLSILDNFLLGRPGKWVVDRRRARGELERLAWSFGFSLDPDAPVSSLTVGERQQLEIVRLLALGAEVLIFDEPTTGISLPQKVKLFETLRRLAEQGKTVIFVSHKLQDVEDLCSRVTVLRRGRVTGHLERPFTSEQLVALMFGQALSVGTREGVELGAPVLELENVCVQDYRLRVPGLNLSVRAGEVVGLAGIEGSGQRLVLRACAGLDHPAAGAIRILGQEMTRRPYREYLAQGAAYLPAGRLEEGLVPGLTIAEHLLLVNHPDRFFIDWENARQEAQGRIAQFNIRGAPSSTVESLSGGNQQRTLLSLLRPGLKLLLLEHPTRGLDIESTLWVWNQLLARRREGCAIIFASADLDEIVQYSDRILVFSGGRVAAPLAARETTVEQLGELIGGKGL